MCKVDKFSLLTFFIHLVFLQSFKKLLESELTWMCIRRRGREAELERTELEVEINGLPSFWKTVAMELGRIEMMVDGEKQR